MKTNPSQDTAVQNVRLHHEKVKQQEGTFLAGNKKIYFLEKKTALLGRIHQVFLKVLKFLHILSDNPSKVKEIYNASVQVLKQDPLWSTVLQLHHKSDDSQEKLQKQKDDQAQLINELDKQIKAKEDKLAELKEKVEEFESQHTKKLTAFLDTLNQYEKKIPAKIKELRQLEKQIDQLKNGELADVKQQISDLQKKLEKYQTEVKSYTEAEKKWLKKNKPTKVDYKLLFLLKDLERNNALFTKQLVQANKNINYLKMQLKIKEAELEQAQQEAKKKQSQPPTNANVRAPIAPFNEQIVPNNFFSLQGVDLQQQRTLFRQLQGK